MRQNHNTSHAATSIMQVTRHSTADDVDTRVVPPISTKLYMCKTSMHAFFIRTTTSHKIKKASAFKIKEYAKINHHLLSDLEQLLLTQAFVAVCDGRCRCRWRSQWKVINSTSAFVSPCRCRSLRRWSGWRKSRQLNTSIARAHKALCSIPLESTTIRWVHPDIVLALTIAGATNKRHCVPCVNKWNTCTEPMYKNSIDSDGAYKINPKTLKCMLYKMWFALQINNKTGMASMAKGVMTRSSSLEHCPTCSMKCFAMASDHTCSSCNVHNW